MSDDLYDLRLARAGVRRRSRVRGPGTRVREFASTAVTARPAISASATSASPANGDPPHPCQPAKRRDVTDRVSRLLRDGLRERPPAHVADAGVFVEDTGRLGDLSARAGRCAATRGLRQRLRDDRRRSRCLPAGRSLLCEWHLKHALDRLKKLCGDDPIVAPSTSCCADDLMRCVRGTRVREPVTTAQRAIGLRGNGHSRQRLFGGQE